MNNDFLITTANYNTIKHLCEDVFIRSKMVSIIGYPGAGKTTALLQMKNEFENVYYVRATASMNAKEFYLALQKEIDNREINTSTPLHYLINNISSTLNNNTEKKMIIIDETGKFKFKFLEYLHELRDNTMQTTGIILAGPEYFHKNLIKWKNRNVIGIPEIYRRISHWEYLDRPTKKEIRAFCEVYGLNDEEMIKEIIINSSENFGAIVNAIENYKIQMKKMNK